MAEQMKILVVEPRKHPRVMEIPNTLRDKQAVVDGLIQPVELDDGAIIVCNEEGLFRPDLEWNRKLYEPFELAIKGTFFLCCGNEDGDFISLTDDLIDKYSRVFYHPQILIPTRKGLIDLSQR